MCEIKFVEKSKMGEDLTEKYLPKRIGTIVPRKEKTIMTKTDAIWSGMS